ncbi:MAG: efflux RND transporter periplasmic adaptor subunit [Clostridiales bacterium]|nr:efflux RND transporter periplasmic adaptor subunit [Clostridiales bacterium]MCF8021488.1 efflux RND transporter periplasmic adaptor subunit [Clostridiales bacterium]
MDNDNTSSKKIKKFLVLLAGIVLVGGIVFFAMNRLKTIQEVPKREHVGVPVNTVEVEKGAISDVITYTGTVRAEHKISLAPKIMAGIESVKCSIGDRVSRGQLLIKLDDSGLPEKINKLEKRLQKVKVDLKHWEKEVKTYKVLWKKGAVSRQKYENILYKRNKARAGVEEARAALREARQGLDNTVIYSPLSGVVTGKIMEEGEMAAPGKPVLKIAGTGSLQVMVNIIEEDLARFDRGTKVKIKLPGVRSKIESSVQEIYPSVNTSTRTAVVEIDLPADTNVENMPRPGMSAGVSIILNHENEALLVPARTVQKRNGDKFVFKVKGKHVVKQEVFAGIKGKHNVEITEGLSAGEIVVKDPPPQLYDGKQVYIPKGEFVS